MKLLVMLMVTFKTILATENEECVTECPDTENMVCSFDIKKRAYKMFANNCAMEGFAKCFDIDFVRTPLKYCIKEHFQSARRVYGESCPVFCPSHYRPVCGASKYRDYLYRTFNNGCYLDMINCRGDDDYTGYVEVPLQFCQNHLMKNIFKEKLVMSNMYDYRE